MSGEGEHDTECRNDGLGVNVTFLLPAISPLVPPPPARVTEKKTTGEEGENNKGHIVQHPLSQRNSMVGDFGGHHTRCKILRVAKFFTPKNSFEACTPCPRGEAVLSSGAGF